MAQNLELIHAGLPWNNPQKITVKADEYISELVINRGLLNLLSNDYYLDLKTERINQYLLQSIGPHTTESTIHWTEDEIVDIIRSYINGDLGSYTEGFGLGGQSVFIIPVDINKSAYDNALRIQNIINQCPKNLNGHVAIFALTPVVNDGDYFRTISEFKKDSQNMEKRYLENYEIDILANNISFNNFYGGTLLVLGNPYFVCEKAIKNKGKVLTRRESRLLLEQIQDDIEKNINYKNIKIVGSGFNTSCSVLSFYNCMCDAFLWNLSVELIDKGTESINNLNLPSKQAISLLYPGNGQNDKLVDTTNKYINSSITNSEDFNTSSVPLKSFSPDMDLGTETVDDEEVHFIELNNSYFINDVHADSVREILFGRSIENDKQQIIETYNGSCIAFWMKSNFYDENITNVPILYSKDINDNGFYIGLERVFSIENNNPNYNQYIETSYASKKRDDLNGKWLFWAINIIPSENFTAEIPEYYIEIGYSDQNREYNKILPSKILTQNYNNKINLPFLNFTGIMNLFGNSEYSYNAQLRNILIFNEPVEQEKIKNIAKLGRVDNYDFNFLVEKPTFKNGMKGAVYAYNNTALNIIGCNFSKIQSEEQLVNG